MPENGSAGGISAGPSGDVMRINYGSVRSPGTG